MRELMLSSRQEALDATVALGNHHLQDWREGRRSEVGDLNGLVVRTLEARARRAPVDEAVVHLAHAIERGALEPEPAAWRSCGVTRPRHVGR